MLALIWGVFAWLRSFIRTRHDLGLEIVALRQQVDDSETPDQAGALAAFRPTVLGSAASSVAAVGESSSHREAGHSRSVASERLPSVLALSIPTQTGWQIDHRARGSDFPAHHGEREPDLGSSPHPRRVVEARVRDFRANRLPIPCAVASPRRGCSTLANVSEESPG